MREIQKTPKVESLYLLGHADITVALIKSMTELQHKYAQYADQFYQSAHVAREKGTKAGLVTVWSGESFADIAAKQGQHIGIADRDDAQAKANTEKARTIAVALLAIKDGRLPENLDEFLKFVDQRVAEVNEEIESVKKTTNIKGVQNDLLADLYLQKNGLHAFKDLAAQARSRK